MNMNTPKSTLKKIGILSWILVLSIGFLGISMGMNVRDAEGAYVVKYTDLLADFKESVPPEKIAEKYADHVSDDSMVSLQPVPLQFSIKGQMIANTASTPSVLVSLCSINKLEENLDEALSEVVSEVDFSFSVEKRDGRRYNYNRGTSTLQTSYESASTSKLVSAVIILRLVEQGSLNLSDRPQDHIAGWPIGNGDSLYNMTLAQLLSFTSGLETEPFCINAGFSNFATCVSNIADANTGNGITPGQRFYYVGTHLQVAGLMTIKARGVAGWQDIFSEFKAQTGLFPTATYDLPSSTNPRLAGGMHWTGEEYMDFLKALSNGALLNSGSMKQLLSDHAASVIIASSPTVTGLGEDWHYGFGLWHECQNTVFNCTPGTRVSSPGAYGAYPFWDLSKGYFGDYFGIVARQGSLGTFPNGVAIERSVRSKVERWVGGLPLQREVSHGFL